MPPRRHESNLFSSPAGRLLDIEYQGPTQKKEEDYRGLSEWSNIFLKFNSLRSSPLTKERGLYLDIESVLKMLPISPFIDHGVYAEGRPREVTVRAKK